MKKPLLLICTFFFLVVIVAGIILFHLSQKETYENGALVVNGKRIIQSDTTLHRAHAIVPLVKVLKALDFPVEESDERVIVSINNKVFILDVTKASFSEEGSSSNLLRPPPGIRSYYCRVEKGDVFLDTVTLKSVLYLAGFNIAIDVDYEKGEVVIYSF